jgi:hypothetical protein
MDLQHDTFPFRNRIAPGGATRLPRRIGSGQKIVAMKTAKSTQHPAALAGQRLRCQCSRFVRSIGFVEERETDIVTIKVIGGREQALFRRGCANDQMRMIGIGWEELTGFQRGVCGLHRDLRSGQVRADQNVNVRNLAERRIHGMLLFPIIRGKSAPDNADRIRTGSV